MAADVGTLQRLPRCCGNASWVNEICFTGRKFHAQEAYHQGLVNHLLPTQEQALGTCHSLLVVKDILDVAMDIAKTIASKSPLAIYGTKYTLTASLLHVC